MMRIAVKYILVLLLAVNAGLCESAAQPINVAEIIYVAGTVKVKSIVTKEWIDAEVGMKVKEGDIVKTGADSKAELAFGEDLDNIIKIFQNSQLTVSKLQPGLLNLTDGRVFTLIEKLGKGSTFEVRTPTAVAGARGTGWETAFEGKEDRTVVKGYERSIYVAGLDEAGNLIGERRLKKGFKSMIERAREPGIATRLSRQEMRVWRRWKVSATRRLRTYKKRSRKRPEATEKRLERATQRMDKLLRRVETLRRVEKRLEHRRGEDPPPGDDIEKRQ